MILYRLCYPELVATETFLIFIFFGWMIKMTKTKESPLKMLKTSTNYVVIN